MSSSAILYRSAHVLDLDQSDGTLAFKGSITVYFSEEKWTDMGEPVQITVTIQPGDHLTES